MVCFYFPEHQHRHAVSVTTSHSAIISPAPSHLLTPLSSAGIFKRDAHEVLDFIIKLIGQARRWSQTLPLDSVYHCLNRAVLYILSRPTDSVGEQLKVLEALHTLTNHR